MRNLFFIKPLVAAMATMTIASFASAAGLSRSNQDTTAFFQDGTYAEATYTYIDADVTGVDSSGNKLDDIAEDYDFFRYGVKTDINDTFSIGVLYDEPWGAAANYVGDNDFTGAANRTGAGAIQRVANNAIQNTQQKIANIQALQSTVNPVTQPYANTIYNSALNGLNNTLTNFNDLASQPTLTKFNSVVSQSSQNLQTSKTTLNGLINSGVLDATTSQNAQALLAKNEQDVQNVTGARNVIQDFLNIDDNTNVEVRTQSVTGILGMKLGQNKEFQVYGGPVAQRLKADVRLRGDAYLTATNYDLNANPNTDYGWIAGLQYSKPEIALKAALTYRSEIEHSIDVSEHMPLLALTGGNPNQINEMQVTTPESVNFDFQTGINSTTLATANVRWVPWNDFAVTPPLYNTATKQRYPQGLDLIDYDDDQWQVELGLAKRVADNLAVSGTVGWDSGAGNPVTSLGPVEGYYSVGLGAKFNIDKNWAVSAGGKYLWLGDADGSIPNGDVVSKFEDNDGFAAGLKLSYHAD